MVFYHREKFVDAHNVGHPLLIPNVIKTLAWDRDRAGGYYYEPFQAILAEKGYEEIEKLGKANAHGFTARTPDGKGFKVIPGDHLAIVEVPQVWQPYDAAFLRGPRAERDQRDGILMADVTLLDQACVSRGGNYTGVMNKLLARYGLGVDDDTNNIAVVHHPDFPAEVEGMRLDHWLPFVIDYGSLKLLPGYDLETAIAAAQACPIYSGMQRLVDPEYARLEHNFSWDWLMELSLRNTTFLEPDYNFIV
ncbi:MAG: hypothetical protein J0L97_00675 [Alphaproteobacteria bacterium]|nr:hypothetical protein [Alphaproteobacteria bacterium]